MIVEQNMILVQWGCKTCLILIYYRLTFLTYTLCLREAKGSKKRS
ncbi:hypothetical protein N7509_008183 [Penicillium cosmopolitanum]|uniref:Uncharacterized protein n=1 Tax=Penicillium cosmopolitanum TaxID=1131564 RepID=A0A9X0B2D6_9EURO|nr:uncharacterized protein N7509_008183 [Penicillium cosmopolitanum]KAJ5385642.1 hypothetical protein N7509_008183 [Penicillium cosmopolitanum]